MGNTENWSGVMLRGLGTECADNNETPKESKGDEWAVVLVSARSATACMVWESRVSSPVESGAEPPPQMDLAHLSIINYF